MMRECFFFLRVNWKFSLVRCTTLLSTSDQVGSGAGGAGGSSGLRINSNILSLVLSLIFHISSPSLNHRRDEHDTAILYS